MQLFASLAQSVHAWWPGGSPLHDSYAPPIRSAAPVQHFPQGIWAGLLAALRRHAETAVVEGSPAPMWLVKYEMAQALAGCSETIRELAILSIYQASSVSELRDLIDEVGRHLEPVLGPGSTKERVAALNALIAGWERRSVQS